MPTREFKAGVIKDLESIFVEGKVAIVADLNGYTVAELTQFRRSLDKQGAKCRVAKNTLVKIATEKTQFKAIAELAKGPTTVVVGYDNPSSPC